jgi:hypothetical protein
VLALGSVAFAGCSVFASLDGLSGAVATADAAGSDSWTTLDAPLEEPSADGAGGVVDAASEPDADTNPLDSMTAVVDSSQPTDSPIPGDASASDAPPSDAPPSDAPAEVSADAGSVYANTVLSDAPLAYWRVDEASGTVAHDATGNGNDAYYTGGVTLGSGGALIGDTDTAATLDGVTGHLDVGDRFGFTGNATYTLEVWAQPQKITTSYQRLFSRELPTTPREGYLLFVRAGYAADPSTFSLERWSAGSTNQCPETNAITQVWHHFVATYDGSTSHVYLDGVLAASQPAPLPLNSTTASLWIGASSFDTAGYFAGVVDEVAVYGTALSAARITAHFHASGR